jgi:hypothetical protein
MGIENKEHITIHLYNTDTHTTHSGNAALIFWDEVLYTHIWIARKRKTYFVFNESY